MTDPDLQALHDEAVELAAQAKHKDATKVLGRLFSRFEEIEADDPTMASASHAPIVSQSMLLAAQIAEQLGHDKQARQLFDAVPRKCGDSTDVGVRSNVITAMQSKAGNLRGRRRGLKDALATYDEALERLGDPTEPELRLRLVEVLNARAQNLSELKRHDDARAAYDRAIDAANVPVDDPEIQQEIDTDRAWAEAKLAAL